MSKTKTLCLWLDKQIYDDLGDLAHALDKPVDVLVTSQIKLLLQDRGFDSTQELVPSPYLEKILRKSGEDLRLGQNIGPPMNKDEASEHLRSMM